VQIKDAEKQIIFWEYAVAEYWKTIILGRGLDLGGGGADSRAGVRTSEKYESGHSKVLVESGFGALAAVVEFVKQVGFGLFPGGNQTPPTGH